MATELEQPNIEGHSESKFQRLVECGLRNGGIHVCAGKNHGKSRLLFSMAKDLQRGKARVLIFDGSETWLYAYDKIPTFTVQDRDITLIEDVKTTEEIERYQVENWNLVVLALEKYDAILFRLKTRKPSKRGFFVRTVINYLDQKQREERETSADHEAGRYFAYFIEEAQDCFNSRSTTRLEAEEFLTVFNEARNQKEAFFTASQRLTDFSKTIRTKQAYCMGRISEEDHGGLRHLEKAHRIDFSEMKLRTWFMDGETFESPEWRQDGKPYQINKEVKKDFLGRLPKPERRGLGAKVLDAFKFLGVALNPLGWFENPARGKTRGKPAGGEDQGDEERQRKKDEEEDSEFDGILGMGGEDALFPPEYGDEEDV